MSSIIEFNGRMNVFTNEFQLSSSSLQIGQYAKVTETGKEYQIVDGTGVTVGVRLSNNNRAIPLSEVIREFNTMSDVRDCSNLKIGDKVRTWGYTTAGDSEGNDYIIIDSNTASLAPVEGDVYLTSELTARVVVRKVGQTEKIASVVVPAGTATVEINLPNLSKSPKIFLDGILLIAGEHYMILDHTKGIIKLNRTYPNDVNLVVIDSVLFTNSQDTNTVRYNSFIIPANTTEVNCGLARLSAHPLLIVNGLHLTLGVHWNIVDGSTGDIAIVTPYEKDAEASIMDNIISGSIDASTIVGFTSDDLVKTETTIEKAKENAAKSKYKIGDVIMITEPSVYFVKLEDTAGPGAVPVYEVEEPEEGEPEPYNIYFNYWFRDKPYIVNTVEELQNSNLYSLNDIVSVLGDNAAGDGQHHLRIKVAEPTETTVPALDGSNQHWELVPNSKPALKADSGGSDKTLKELEDAFIYALNGNKINITTGPGLTGEGGAGTVNINLHLSSQFTATEEDGLSLKIINDLTSGGVDIPLSGEQGKVLKGALDTLQQTVSNMESNKINIVAGNGISGSGNSGNVTISIKKKTDSSGSVILLDGTGLGIRYVNDLVTGGTNALVTAEQAKSLYNKLLALKAVVKEKAVYRGELPANGKSIATGKTLYSPALYLDGVRIDSNDYSVSGGTINLNYVYSPSYTVVWTVEDFVPTTVSLADLSTEE